jgi:hypothetical protein
MRGRNVVPRRIIFYRDGVSEGQFDEVGRKEVNQVKGNQWPAMVHLNSIADSF